MDAANLKLAAIKEYNADLQDFVMDEFSRFTLQMGYVIDMGRLMSHFNFTDDELVQLKPFYNYVMLSQDHCNSLINEMIIFSYQPRCIPFKYLQEKQLTSVSNLIGEAHSQVKQKFAEAQEFKSSSDYMETSQTLQENRIALIAQIDKLKDFVRENGIRDEEATEKLKSTVFPQIANICSQMFETISTFNINNNKLLATIDEVVKFQKDLTTKISLANFL